MKILLVSEFFPTGKGLKFSGGVEARNFYIARNLSQKDEVIVITSRVEDSPKTEKIGKIKIIRVGPRRKYQPTFGDLVKRIQFIASAIKEGASLKPDIVEGTNFVTHFVAKGISRKNNIPSVAWYPDVWIGSWIKNVGLAGILGEILERINLYSSFDSFIAISANTSKKLAQRKVRNVSIIHCGVDLSEFKNNVKKFSNKTIISVSRLAKYKNIKDLILAFALLQTKIKNTSLIIVGTGPEKKSLEKLIKQLKLEKKISFYSNLPRKELVELVKKSHVFCLPSTVEGFGIATIEAAAAGLPYVVSDIPVFREITKNGQGGLIFKLGNTRNLAEKLEKLIKDKKLYQLKMKEAAVLAKNYDWEKIARQTKKVYEKTVQNYGK